jgi:hypothetical protein
MNQAGNSTRNVKQDPGISQGVALMIRFTVLYLTLKINSTSSIMRKSNSPSILVALLRLPLSEISKNARSDKVHP